MSCDRFQLYELGEIDELSFRRHVADCDECRQAIARDTRLMELAGSLKSPVSAPQLWDRIEATVQADGTERGRTRRRSWIYRIAAVLVVGVGLAATFDQLSTEPIDSNASLYTARALEQVEERQRDYLAAIEELEQVADARFDRMDMELIVLYRDKIATIDTQIARCQQALARNPANSHIHRYLFLALQDKEETLQEILRLDL